MDLSKITDAVSWLIELLEARGDAESAGEVHATFCFYVDAYRTLWDALRENVETPEESQDMVINHLSRRLEATEAVLLYTLTRHNQTFLAERGVCVGIDTAY